MTAERVSNIGQGEQRQRFRFGVMMYALSAFLAAALVLFSVSPWLRIFVAIPLWFGGLGLFQANEKT